jgi:hypothetical protein
MVLEVIKIVEVEMARYNNKLSGASYFSPKKTRRLEGTIKIFDLRDFFIFCRDSQFCKLLISTFAIPQPPQPLHLGIN